MDKKFEEPLDLEAERVTFLLDILDERHEIEDNLREKFTTSEVRTSGYEATVCLPTTLHEFALTDSPINVSVDSVVVRSRLDQTVAGFTSITISPDDRLPFTIKNDHGLVTIEQAGVTLVDATGKLLHNTLRSFFRNASNSEKLERTSDLALLDIIATLSPGIARYYEYVDETDERNVTVRWIAGEEVDDSKEAISIELVRPHVCDAQVGTRITIHESLLNRLKALDDHDINQTADILAVRDHSDVLTVEDILSNQEDKVIPIRKITPYHMSDVLDALQVLKQARP